MYSMESVYHAVRQGVLIVEEGVGDLPTSVHRVGPIRTFSRDEHWAERCLLRYTGKKKGPTENPSQSTCLIRSYLI